MDMLKISCGTRKAVDLINLFVKSRLPYCMPAGGAYSIYCRMKAPKMFRSPPNSLELSKGYINAPLFRHCARCFQKLMVVIFGCIRGFLYLSLCVRNVATYLSMILYVTQYPEEQRCESYEERTNVHGAAPEGDSILQNVLLEVRCRTFYCPKFSTIWRPCNTSVNISP